MHTCSRTFEFKASLITAQDTYKGTYKGTYKNTCKDTYKNARTFEFKASLITAQEQGVQLLQQSESRCVLCQFKYLIYACGHI